MYRFSLKMLVSYGTMWRKEVKVVKEIRDERKLENYFEKYQYHFQKRPPVIKL